MINQRDDSFWIQTLEALTGLFLHLNPLFVRRRTRIRLQFVAESRGPYVSPSLCGTALRFVLYFGGLRLVVLRLGRQKRSRLGKWTWGATVLSKWARITVIPKTA